MARRLLLISNSTSHPTGYLEHCSPNIKSFLDEHPNKVKNVLFVPYADTASGYDSYTAKAKLAFSKLGFDLKGIHEYKDVQQAVNETEAIFIGGGNTFRLLKCLWEQKLLEIIQKRVLNGEIPYIGTSAGTNVATVSIKTTNDMPIVYPPSFDALNLVPFNINPHYLDADPNSTHMGETREQRIKEFLDENDKIVVGLREGAMLKVIGNEITLEGVNGARIFQRGSEPSERKTGDNFNFLLNK